MSLNSMIARVLDEVAAVCGAATPSAQEAGQPTILPDDAARFGADQIKESDFLDGFADEVLRHFSDLLPGAQDRQPVRAAMNHLRQASRPAGGSLDSQLRRTFGLSFDGQYTAQDFYAAAISRMDQIRDLVKLVTSI